MPPETAAGIQDFILLLPAVRSARIILRVDATLLSFAAREGSRQNPVPGNQ